MASVGFDRARVVLQSGDRDVGINVLVYDVLSHSEMRIIARLVVGRDSTCRRASLCRVVDNFEWAFRIWPYARECGPYRKWITCHDATPLHLKQQRNHTGRGASGFEPKTSPDRLRFAANLAHRIF